jgi:hypothetical protein
MSIFRAVIMILTSIVIVTTDEKPMKVFAIVGLMLMIIGSIGVM